MTFVVLTIGIRLSFRVPVSPLPTGEQGQQRGLPSQCGAAHGVYLNASLFEGKAEKQSCGWPLRRYRLGRSRKVRHLALVALQFVR